MYPKILIISRNKSAGMVLAAQFPPGIEVRHLEELSGLIIHPIDFIKEFEIVLFCMENFLSLSRTYCNFSNFNGKIGVFGHYYETVIRDEIIRLGASLYFRIEDAGNELRKILRINLLEQELFIFYQVSDN